MKSFILLLIFLAASNTGFSQILRRIKEDIKNEAEWKLRNKTRKKVNDGIDSLMTPSQKTEKKNRKKNNTGQ